MNLVLSTWQRYALIALALVLIVALFLLVGIQMMQIGFWDVFIPTFGHRYPNG